MTSIDKQAPEQPATELGAGGDATEIVTEIVPDLGVVTQEAPEAWSQDEMDGPEESYSWSAAAERAAIVLMRCVAAAIIVGLLTWFGFWIYDKTKPTQDTPTASYNPPMSAAALPPIAADPVPSAPDASPTVISPDPEPTAATDDQVFLRLLGDIPRMRITNTKIAEDGGRQVCDYLRDGHSRADTEAAVLQNDPTFTRWQSSAFVNAATVAYCPQYG